MKINKLAKLALYTTLVVILFFPSNSYASERLASVARRDLGVREGSSRANYVAQKSGLRSSIGRANAWCASIQSDWIIKSGYKIKRTASVYELNKNLSKKYRYGSRPRIGAVVIYKHSHTGTVVRILDNGYFVAIEGNHNNKVEYVTRHVSNAKRFYYLGSQS